MPRRGYGKRDGSQQGQKQQGGGRGRNQTSNCRHPSIKKNRRN